MAKDLPERNTVNPPIGVTRCVCGEIMTIHQARGKRANYLYSICECCGTDQRTGKRVQARFKANYPTISALLEAEQAEKATVASDPVTQNQGTDTDGKEKPQSQPKETPPTLPETGSESRDSEATTITAASRTPSPTSQTETNTQSDDKPPFWAIFRGIVIGAICGGVISRI